MSCLKNNGTNEFKFTILVVIFLRSRGGLCLPPQDIRSKSPFKWLEFCDTFADCGCSDTDSQV